MPIYFENCKQTKTWKCKQTAASKTYFNLPFQNVLDQKIGWNDSPARLQTFAAVTDALTTVHSVTDFLIARRVKMKTQKCASSTKR